MIGHIHITASRPSSFDHPHIFPDTTGTGNGLTMLYSVLNLISRFKGKFFRVIVSA